MPDNTKMEATLHEYINTLATIKSSLQLIQKQHPEVVEFNFWTDVMESIQSLSSSIITQTQSNQIGKSDPTS